MPEEEGFVDFTVLMHCGVYMLLRKGEVVYVGQSKSVGERLRTHCRQRKGGVRGSGLFANKIKVGFSFDEIQVRACMLGELDDLERAMIKKYQPKYNVKLKNPQPSLELQMLIDMMPSQCIADELPKPPRPASWRRL